jgi:hypothetical protein
MFDACIIQIETCTNDSSSATKEVMLAYTYMLKSIMASPTI